MSRRAGWISPSAKRSSTSAGARSATSPCASSAGTASCTSSTCSAPREPPTQSASAASPRGSVFGSRDFRLFYVGQAASYVGDGLRTIALPLLVFKITGSALNLGVTYALEWWSFGIFSLVGGSLADRVNRKSLMIACDLLRSAIILAFALGYRAGWLTLPLLYAGIELHASCGAVFNGGQASSIPYVVGKARATRAVAVLSGTESAVGTVSTPLGGALFGLMGPLPALLLNAVTYLASVASLGTIRDLGPEQTSGLPRFRHIADDVRIGFRFLFADRAMRLISLASLFGNFLGMMEYTALVPLIKRNLGGSDFSVGIAFGALGAGSVVGAVLAPRLHASFGKIVVAAYALGWIAYLPIAWTRSFTVLTIALFVS